MFEAEDWDVGKSANQLDHSLFGRIKDKKNKRSDGKPENTTSKERHASKNKKPQKRPLQPVDSLPNKKQRTENDSSGSHQISKKQKQKIGTVKAVNLEKNDKKGKSKKKKISSPEDEPQEVINKTKKKRNKNKDLGMVKNQTMKDKSAGEENKYKDTVKVKNQSVKDTSEGEERVKPTSACQESEASVHTKTAPRKKKQRKRKAKKNKYKDLWEAQQREKIAASANDKNKDFLSNSEFVSQSDEKKNTSTEAVSKRTATDIDTSIDDIRKLGKEITSTKDQVKQKSRNDPDIIPDDFSPNKKKRKLSANNSGSADVVNSSKMNTKKKKKSRKDTDSEVKSSSKLSKLCDSLDQKAGVNEKLLEGVDLKSRKADKCNKAPESMTPNNDSHLSKKKKKANQASLASKSPKSKSSLDKGIVKELLMEFNSCKEEAKSANKGLDEGSEENVEEKNSPSLQTKQESKPQSLREKMMDRLHAARFRYLNEQLYTVPSHMAVKMFRSDPEAFRIYHDGFQSQVAKWPQSPVNTVIDFIKKRSPNEVVADFGCGDAKIAQSVKNKVHSFDLVAVNKHVTVCDMTKTPLMAESIGIAVFCLALMGTNLVDFLAEANRVLKKGGKLLIAEVASRFERIGSFVRGVEQMGFSLQQTDTSNKMFVMFQFEKKTDTKNLPKIELQPCVYKKR